MESGLAAAAAGSAGAFPAFDLAEETFRQREDVSGRILHQSDGNLPLLGTLSVGEVIDGRTPRGAGEQAGEGVVGGPRLVGAFREATPRGELVVLPKQGNSTRESLTARRIVMGLAQEMGHRKADVEHGVAPMNDLVVDEDQAIPMNEDVLGAVVAVHQSETAPASLLDQRPQEGSRGGDFAGGEGVERFEAQLLEELNVGKDRFERIGGEAGTPVNGPQQLSKLPDVIGIDRSRQEKGLPILVRWRHGFHGEEVMLLVFEHEGGDRARRRERGQPPHAEGFAVDPFRAAMPGGRDTKSAERLLQHPGVASGPVNQDCAIGDAPGEDLDFGSFRGSYPAGRPEPFGEGLGLFDVEVGHGKGWG